MPRLVRHDHDGPVRLDPASLPPDRLIWICACGLTKNVPFCDGSHKRCRDTEPPGTLCVYDRDRTTIVEVRKDAGGTTSP